MKKLFLITLLLTGCANVGGSSNDCLKRVAASEIAISEAYNTTTKLYLSGTISKSAATKAVKATDTANALTDTAVNLCEFDIAKADQALSDAAVLIAQVKKITGE